MFDLLQAAAHGSDDDHTTDGGKWEDETRRSKEHTRHSRSSRHHDHDHDHDHH